MILGLVVPSLDIPHRRGYLSCPNNLYRKVSNSITHHTRTKYQQSQHFTSAIAIQARWPELSKRLDSLLVASLPRSPFGASSLVSTLAPSSVAKARWAVTLPRSSSRPKRRNHMKSGTVVLREIRRY